MPRCSVLIPAFNVERYVAQAIGSVLAQTYKDLEIIVVNDGSTDQTAREVQRFADRVTYIEQPNKGLAAARNRALAEAGGEFTALLDADDFWPKNRLERMIGFLDLNPRTGLVTSDSFVVYEDRPSGDRIYKKLPGRWGFRDQSQAYWITQYNFMQIHTVIRTALFEKHGAFDERLKACEDWDMWIRFLVAGEKAGLVDEALAYYRLRKGSLSIDRTQILPDEVRVLRKALAANPGASGLEGRIRYGEAKQALAQGKSAAAKHFFGRAYADRSLYGPMRMKALAACKLPKFALAAYQTRSAKSLLRDESGTIARNS